ncbi:superoxide dismutase [Cu-Zn], chloroplastic-like isoform X2 [Dendrobium catenatum]|uniref:Superoxide dismutase [Cu-Zn] n=1 Tax=Dendrobium catenatum TaxID=906689 RepID=A0A2I0W102_9ASPA|nr:superoxide dismutase [Cu-Zn], chloroplastic-like isoform X2 [Dendrobium catenatum]PKU69339.1 Superoxide dismutase [Cu-Zn], chloroplastic [Dendrobium catenatum]
MQTILAAMAAHTVLSAAPPYASLPPPPPPASSASLFLSTFVVEYPLRISLLQSSNPAAVPKPLAVAAAPSTKKAVAVLKGSSQVEGIVTLLQENDGSPTTVKVRVSGLTPGPHGFHVHDYGDITNGCISTGSHFNPNKMTHGAPKDNIRHAGDLGNIFANSDGVAEATIVDAQIPLSGPTAVIGRSFVVHELEDDLGKGGKELSLSTGNAGGRLACGVVGLTPP